MDAPIRDWDDAAFAALDEDSGRGVVSLPLLGPNRPLVDISLVNMDWLVAKGVFSSPVLAEAMALGEDKPTDKQRELLDKTDRWAGLLRHQDRIIRHMVVRPPYSPLDDLPEDGTRKPGHLNLLDFRPEVRRFLCNLAYQNAEAHDAVRAFRDRPAEGLVLPSDGEDVPDESGGPDPAAERPVAVAEVDDGNDLPPGGPGGHADPAGGDAGEDAPPAGEGVSAGGLYAVPAPA